jgi:glycine/D-amino acid oxidase-like deaminating enzyme
MERVRRSLVQPLISVPTLESVPQEADAVVIGGGIIGAATALELSERGMKIVLVEKGAIGGEQSSRNWGWCRTQDRPMSELPLMLRSMDLWQQLSQRLGAESGFHRSGLLTLCSSEEDMEAKRAWLREAGEVGSEAKLLSFAECRLLLPKTTRRWEGGMHSPSDGAADPQRSAPLIAWAAQHRGAAIVTTCAALSIDTEGGSVRGVLTEKGYVKSPIVVVAAGIWSTKLLRDLGLRLPQLGVHATVLQTVSTDMRTPTNASARGFSFTRKLDGSYLISCGSDPLVTPLGFDSFRFLADFAPVALKGWKSLGLTFARQQTSEHETGGNDVYTRKRVLNPPPLKSHVSRAIRNVGTWLPQFQELPIERAWAGIVDATPDSLPVIDASSGISGLVISSGYSGHGFGLGLAAAELTAQLATGETTSVDATPFRISRFH